MATFVDTSAFIALLTAEDDHHEAAGRVWKGLVERDEQLVTSNYVVVETCALLQRRSSMATLRRFLEDMLPLVLIDWVDVHLHTAGVSSVLMSSKRGPSLVDCVTFAAMRKLGIRSAFAFDDHFREQGFEVLGTAD